MPVKADRWIKKMAVEQKMIEPFEASQVKQGVISYGLSSYGYDMRLSDKFRLPKYHTGLIDPKASQTQEFSDLQADSLILEPGHFVLGMSVEYFRIPRHIITICYGKSTYARSGVLCNITPFEPQWEGYVTLMITNTGQRPVKIYANEGIAQVLFLESDEVCEISYADRQGKYQAQHQITHSTV